MAQFGHLKSLAVNGDDTARFTFYEIEGSPSLLVSPATSVNKPFFNAVLRKSKEAARKLRGRKGQIPTDGQLLEVRRQDAKLFVEFILRGWEDVVDADGEAVEFDAEAGYDFLMAIPPDMFDDLRAFCLDISNFRGLEDEPMDPEEQEELSGN